MYPMNQRTISPHDSVFKFITQLHLAGIPPVKFYQTNFQFFSFFEFYRR